jgi:hypothetical protein
MTGIRFRAAFALVKIAIIALCVLLAPRTASGSASCKDGPYAPACRGPYAEATIRSSAGSVFVGSRQQVRPEQPLLTHHVQDENLVALVPVEDSARRLDHLPVA